MTNCPNCGAVVTGYRCEYCETVFDISRNDTIIYRLNFENCLLEAKTRHLLDQAMIKDLYKDALKAMRAYSGVY